MKSNAKPKWLLNGIALASLMSIGGFAVGASTSAAPTHVSDSAQGITQALPADPALLCATGSVMSGGVCTPITNITPAPCPYGQVSSGGSCVPLSQINPPPTSCPTGQVLSGGSCVPLVSQQCPTAPDKTQYVGCPAGQTGSMTQTRSMSCDASTNWLWQLSGWTTSSNTCTPLASGPAPGPTCGTSPDTVQSVSCPAGQSGSISQTRTATCDASTGYAWVMGGWSTVANTCAPVCFSIGGGGPSSCSPTPSPSCQPTYAYWGSSCSGPTTLTPNGSTTTVTNTAGGMTGSATYICSSGTLVAYGAQSCTSTAPTSCPSSSVSWGQCSGNVNGAPIGTQSAASNVNNGYSGTGYFSCGSSGTWQYTGSGTCNQVLTQCPSGSVYWGSCSGTAYAGSIGSQTGVTNVTSGYTGTGYFACGNSGSWQYTGSGSCDAVPTGCPAGGGSFGPWGVGCSNAYYSWGQTPYGSSVTVPSTNSGFTGSVTYTCTTSGWQQGATSCSSTYVAPVTSCPAGYITWKMTSVFPALYSASYSSYQNNTASWSYRTFIGPVNSVPNGGTANVGNSSNPMTNDCGYPVSPSATFTCNNGTWQWVSDTTPPYQDGCYPGGL